MQLRMINNIFKLVRETANRNYKGFFIVISFVCFLGLLLSTLLALPWGNFVSASCRWDCFWYSDIVENGYSRLPLLYDPLRPAQGAWAFFPLYPLLTRTTGYFLALNTQSAGLLVNIILWPFLIFLCYRDLELRNIHVDRFLFSALFVVYPFNIWYTAQYSEAIYGVLLMAAIVTLRSERVGLAALMCALLSTSRPTGFIMTICLSAWWLFSTPRDSKNFIRNAVYRRISDSLLLVAAGGAGLSLFVLYLFYVTGDGFAFAHVEIAWNKKFCFFVFNIFRAFKHKHERAFGIYALLSTLVIGKMCSRKWWLNALLVGTTALLASSTGVQSIERYVFANPLTMQFLACITLSCSRRLIWIALTVMIIMHIATTLLWYKESILVI